ncbi:beta-alanine-activating enzyme isoform X2 [Larimichthys crocea]|uniref:beta-alanine-activating enzyme isoform X2 n=1 Tax=Larimichthys crocea TaxID=215358 RepID=UPI000F5FF39A|nr:beta-alanine-activating enzyme isoform X2 [Larimichthys crocea]
MALQELVAAAAALHPGRAAVTYDGGSVQRSPVSLRYAELAELSGELSRILRKTCSPHTGVIGLCCSDDLFIPVWILGILQSPAAYVPLDPEAPGLLSARVMNRCDLQYCAVKTDILQRFQAALVDHMSVDVRAVLPKFKLTLIEVRLLPSEHKREQTGAQTAEGAGLHDAAGCTDLAYVLHTSGTTGLPKIVRVPHRCILPNILHLRSLFQMSADDVVFLASPLTFDPSVVDIFLALSSGAQLLIIPTVIKKMPGRLAHLLFKAHKTTVLQVTPTLLVRFGHRVLKQEVFSSGSSLRVLALGGEACPSPALLRSWRHEDNKTNIYNIYGITEVSCWACCYKIPESVLQPSDHESFVPLGTPLMDTTVEVRDEHGCIVTEGEGQVFIGGEDRVCLLDDEDTVIPGTMRATGDWVNVKGEQLCYLGRKDRLIKRHGKRVNLDSLQQLILSLPQVEACAVAPYEGSRLLAFVVASTSGDQRAASPLTSVQKQAEQTPSASAEHRDDPHPAVSHHQEEAGGADGDLRKLILSQLSRLLPSYSVPDTLVLVPALCLTSHGKVDMKALIEIYQRQRRCLESDSSRGDVAELKQTLQSLWKETLGLPEDATIDEESSFLLSGGDSLKALHLCEDILSAVGATSPELLEVILDGTFSDILGHVTRITLMLPPLEKSQAKKRHADAPSAAPAKAERKESSAADETRAVTVIRRAGEVIGMKVRETNIRADALGEKESSKKRRDDALGLSLSWSSDTGRCVDASPVLLVRDRTDEGETTTVFIGSHSHRIQALDLITGGLLWERVLGDRIEASAAVSHCGSLVVVGCYDGCVYFLCASSGKTRWMFETGDAVKSCPAVDPFTGLVIVGSHDGHVYALNPKVQQCVWRRHCGGGAVFSSPCLHPSLRQLYVASLGGHLLCLNPDSGDVLWSYRRDVPFFSSPNVSSGRAVIGSVDGNICCFSDTGELVWQFLTKGPVFSSPCLTPDHQRVLCGSHDGCLYCLDGASGSLIWTFQTTGKVYSSPFVFDGSVVGRRRTPLVAAASTDGTAWILDAGDGQTLASFTLPGELFSSPVVWGRSLVVGCRNDFVYCLKLTVKDET